MNLPNTIIDLAHSADLSDADFGAVLRGALDIKECPTHLKALSGLVRAELSRIEEDAKDKRRRNAERVRECRARKKASLDGVSSGASATLSKVLEDAREDALKHSPQPPPPPPQPMAHGYYSSGHVSSSANAIAYRSTTEEQRAFIKAFCKRPNDYVQFNEIYAEAVKEVKPDVLVECARLAVEHQRKTDGDSQKLRRPENWLSDRAWMDFVAEARRNVKDRNVLDDSSSSLSIIADLNPNDIGVIDDEEIS